MNKVFFFGIFLVMIILIQFIVVPTYYPDNKYNELYQGIIVEAFGFMADILLFGIFITLYENFLKKKESITRYLEEIEDYRGWSEKEASYRIFGLLKRLFQLNKFDIDLSHCFFDSVQFSNNIMSGFDFKESLFYGTKFKNCNLQLSNFTNINQKQISDYYDYCTITEMSIFENCNLRDSKFKNNQNYIDLEFIECDMTNSDFSNSKFLWCSFKAIDFKQINTTNTIFKECKFDENCKNIENLK